MRSKLLVAHVHSLEATFQAYAAPVQGTPLAMSDLLCPLDFLHQAACSSAAPALNNVSLVLGRLCNQSPWSLEVGTVVAVLPEKPTLHENFWLASVLSFTHPNVTVHWSLLITMTGRPTHLCFMMMVMCMPLQWSPMTALCSTALNLPPMPSCLTSPSGSYSRLVCCISRVHMPQPTPRAHRVLFLITT